MSELSVLLDGLTFPEGPRWHEGRLWFSDFYAHEVVAVDLDGTRETIAEVGSQPSGLGCPTVDCSSCRCSIGVC
jgi:sugar lactone lactonase YvrE